MDENRAEWIEKLEQYCAYQERCIFEVEQKMYRLKIDKKYFKELITHLKEHQFLDEERYVNSFIRSKINHKKDGLQKIRFALKSKKIPDFLIENGLKEYDKEIYRNNLSDLIQKKWTVLILKNSLLEAKSKLTRYLMAKGYQYEDFKNLLGGLS